MLLGFDVGVADGQMNQVTIDAIRAYQDSYKNLTALDRLVKSLTDYRNKPQICAILSR
jgi:peptidoglycan hydrolase-like protein with peptidoglycan-binding domain